MKLIVPMARKSSTHSKIFRPSPLLKLIGKPIILRVLEGIKNIKITEAIFIVEAEDEKLKELITKNFKFKTKFVIQKTQKGVAHAIYEAKKLLKKEPCLILFADSIIKTDLTKINKLKEDAIIWTKQVDDPRKLGVVFTQEGLITRLIEKPETPVSDLAMVGMYYIKNSDELFNAINFLIKNNILTKEEYQLTDALQLMINKGNKLVNENVETWLDCGSKKKLLETHKELLIKQNLSPESKGNIIIKPVYIEKGAEITNSIIGPFVSVGKFAKITKSIITESIICEESIVEEHNLKESLIGKQAKVSASAKKINVKEKGEIHHE